MTTAAVPQHVASLAKANELRLARAEIKRDLAAGRTSIGQVLDEPSVQTMRVAALLAAQNRWGAHRARRIVTNVPCSEFLAVSDLTPRQRNRLLELLEQGS